MILVVGSSPVSSLSTIDDDAIFVINRLCVFSSYTQTPRYVLYNVVQHSFHRGVQYVIVNFAGSRNVICRFCGLDLA